MRRLPEVWKKTGQQVEHEQRLIVWRELIFKHGEHKKVDYLNLIILLSGCIFIAQVVYFSIQIQPGIPPDEAFHIRQSLVFYLFPGFRPPLENLDAWQGTDSRSFFLYHLIMFEKPEKTGLEELNNLEKASA